jgi:hypothetical protein
MSTISARTEVRGYRFLGTEDLYRDARGRRVVADFEGAGEWKVEVAETPILVLRDEERTEAFHGSFAESLSVLALGPGEVRVRIEAGSPAPVLAPEWVEGCFEGSGWVVAAEGALTVDARREPAPETPVPFFRCAEARRLAVVRVGPPAVRIDGFRVDDASGMKDRGWRVQNMSRVKALTSRFADGTERTGPVASHLNVASWVTAIPPDNRGLRLRKTYDRFHGRQRARVFADGRFVGWWYEPVEDRTARWGVAEFGIPEAFTYGRSSVHLAVDPPAGSPLWSWSEMEVWAIPPAEPASPA